MDDRKRVRLYNNENAMNIAVKLYDKSDKFLSLFNKILQKGDIKSYSIILTVSKYEEFKDFLANNKRRSDLLLEIDKEQNIYALICPDTELEGSFYFYKRISEKLYKISEYNMFASVLSLDCIVSDKWELIYNVTKPFIGIVFNDDNLQDIVLNRYTK